MGRGGFTLVELIVVIAIMAGLLAIGTLQFSTYSRKSSIDSQTRTMLADLMTVRSQAMYEKRRRAVQLTATSFAIYSSDMVTGTPPQLRTLKNTIMSNDLVNPMIFDSRGVLTDAGNRTICIEPSNNPGVSDSLVVATTRIQVGKRSSNFTGCDSDHVTIQ